MTRIQKAQKLVEENGLQALIIDNPTDLFYLTGQKVSLGRLVVTGLFATFFVDGRYFEACQNSCGCEVMLTSGYSKESSFGKWWQLAGKKVGFDADSTPYSEFLNLSSLGAELIPLRGPLSKLREIKEPSEIEALRKAAHLNGRGFEFAQSHLREGITEEELARELKIFWLQEGSEKLAFDPHIAFGDGSSQPHYNVSGRRLQKGDLVLMDIGVVVDHYHSDMTRVVFWGGKPTDALSTIYQIVYEAYAKALEICKAGVRIGDVDKAARAWITKSGYGPNFTHSLGHGVGLEIHESPRIRSIGPDADRLLESGMVITIEPGIYLPGIGGVRLEDTVLVLENGYEKLTPPRLSSKPPLG